MSESPLSGLKVLDMSWIVAGPTMARALADYGATVVKVESPRHQDAARFVGPFRNGDARPENSTCYGNSNAGKLSVALDLDKAEAKVVLRDLIRWADVLSESFTPGVMDRLGFGYTSVRDINPKIIMVSSSLMGQTGPHAGLSGGGNVGSAMSGFGSIVGWPDLVPLGPFGPYTDTIAPRFALFTLLAALDQRQRTGEGCYIDVSQVEASMHFLAPQVAQFFSEGVVAERQGNRDGAMVPHGVYPCLRDGDGSPTWIAIAIEDDDRWRAFAGIIDAAEVSAERFATLRSRLEHEDELDHLVSRWTATQLPRELERTLQEAGVGAHVASSSRDAFCDAQLMRRNHFIQVEDRNGDRSYVESSRLRFSRTRADIPNAAPLVGQHTDHVLLDLLDYSEERVTALRRAGAAFG